MPMFLASLGLKDAFYGVIIAIILAVFGWVYLKGEQHIEAKDAKAEVKQELHVAKVETQAADTITQDKTHEAQTEAQPIAPVAPIRLCKPAANPVPTAARADRSEAQPTVIGSRDSGLAPALPDPVALVQIGRDDDAYIAALESEIAALRTEMEKSNAPRR